MYLKQISLKLTFIFIFSIYYSPLASETKCLNKLKSVQKQKHYPKLRKIAYQCSKKYRKNAEIFYLRGLFDFELKEYPKAIKSLKRSVQLDETKASSFQLLLRSYLLNKSKSKSFKWLIKKYALQFKEEPTVLLTFADNFVEFSRLKTSFFYLKYLVEQKSKSPWLYLLKLGEIHYSVKSYDKAIKFFEASLRDNPKSSFTMFCLGKTWLAKEKYKFALSYYQHAKTLGANQKLIDTMNKDFHMISTLQKKNQK